MALETSRMQQLTTDLQAALSYNAGISTAQPYEFAVKLFNELLIRHQMNQPMTQALYQQALAMAQQGAGTIGNTASDLVPFLAACDQAQFIEPEGAHERMHVHSNEKNNQGEPLKISPNPSQGWLDVQFQPGAGTQFVIFNSVGRPVKQLPAPAGASSVTVDLSGEPTGIYHVVLLNQANKVIAQNRITISR